MGGKRGGDREEMRKKLDMALRKRDDRIREEMGECVKVVEEREGGARDTVKNNLEEILDRRENRMRELVREDVRKMLEERSR